MRIGVRGGTIDSVETGVSATADDEQHGVALSGMPNLHSHAFQRAIAGLTSRRGPVGDSFWSWRDVMYRFLERLTPDDVLAIAAQAYVEMLEAGFTRVGEFHYLHHDRHGVPYFDVAENCARIVEAASDTGIGLTLLPVFYAHGDFGGAPATSLQARFVNDEARYLRLLEAARRHCSKLDDAIVGVAPHSLRAVTPSELQTVVELGAGVPIHIHIAEQNAEVTTCLAWSGQRPVAWLFDHVNVGANWCLVHATHLDHAERGRLVRSGAIAGLCPITEADLGDGFFPAVEYVSEGGPFGIGSDSNVLIDVGQELRCLEYGQRLLHQARNVLAAAPGESVGRTLVSQATRGGGRALGRVSVLAPGSNADFISLNLEHPTLVGRREDALLDSWIFASRESAIDCVWRRGRCLVKGGRHVRRSSIAARYARTIRRLLT